MDPITLGLLIGGGTALNELTTGKEQQRRDAALKANIYRLMAYQPRLNPESQQIYQPDPLGKGLQGGMAGYQLGSNINRNSAMERFFNKEAGRGGNTESELLDPTNTDSLLSMPESSEGPQSNLFLNRTRGQPDQIYRAQYATWNPYRSMRGYS